MNALLAIFSGFSAGYPASELTEPLFEGNNSLNLALERSRLFPGVGKIVVFTGSADNSSFLIPHSSDPALHIENRPFWTLKTLLETLAVHSEGFDLTYYVWADCPFLDPELAGKIAERHLSYAAEYSYADGWPYGFAPEVLSPGTAAVLAKILGDDNSPVKRDSLFSVIQKDINAFDIETEISPVDLRCHRLNFCADSKRNMLLLKRFIDVAGNVIPDTSAVERIIAEKPEILRTLPAFFPVQVFGGCPQSCSVCPWPKVSKKTVTERRDYMEINVFESLLDKIAAFSGDAVISLSLWGELALHPQKIEFVEAVLRRPELALVIETSGIGWKKEELERCLDLAGKAAAVIRNNALPPLSWIVSLDSDDPARYREIRGAGFAEAKECAKKLFSLFPKDTYVQAVRTVGAEDDIEKFYRTWKETAPNTANIIIQKYDDFCGLFEKKQASDLSPVKREPCWHLMRDMPVYIDGMVPLCREQITSNAAGGADGITLGNIFSEPLEVIWERGLKFYAEHCVKKYENKCAECDEYYTYNF